MGSKPIIYDEKIIREETTRSYRFKFSVKLKFRLVPQVKAYLGGEFKELRVVQVEPKKLK
jgi:hypothetical protein